MLKRRRKWLVVGAAVLLVLVTLRICLPIWVKQYVNDEIAALPEYSGSIGDIDIHLWRGSYDIYDLKIVKARDTGPEPFIAARAIDLAVQWRALFYGKIVAEIEIFEADLTFAKNQRGEGGGWVAFIDALSPLAVNRLEVHDSRIRFVDYDAEPEVDLAIKNIELRLTNLRDVEGQSQELPSEIDLTGQSIGGGNLSLTGRLNIIQRIPDFDLQLALEDAQLAAFNNFTRDRSGIDFREGTLGVFAELAAADGRVVGYVKPVARDVKVIGNENENPLDLLWQSFAALFLEVFKNRSQDQFAFRIPIEGRIDRPDRDLWSAFLSIFSNAFGEAFSRNPDGTIDFEDALKKAREGDSAKG